MKTMANYRIAKCCKSCKHSSEIICMTFIGLKRQPICKKYDKDIHDFCVCDYYEERTLYKDKSDV